MNDVRLPETSDDLDSVMIRGVFLMMDRPSDAAFFNLLLHLRIQINLYLFFHDKTYPFPALFRNPSGRKNSNQGNAA